MFTNKNIRYKTEGEFDYEKHFSCNIVFLNVPFSGYAQISPQLVVKFEGNKAVSPNILLSKLNLCVNKYQDSKEIYNARLYDYCLQKVVLGFLQSKGYWKAKVGEAKIETLNQNLTVTVPVEEEAIYRLGSVEINGAKVFSSKQLLENLKLKIGDIADSEEIRDWLYERVKNLYAEKGYIQADFDLSQDFKPIAGNESEKIVNIKIDVEEGNRFTIGRILFVGNAQTPDQLMRNTLAVKEGEAFNQKRFDESIEKLNKMGLFERIDKDKDVMLRTDEEIPVLLIKITVKEK